MEQIQLFESLLTGSLDDIVQYFIKPEYQVKQYTYGIKVRQKSSKLPILIFCGIDVNVIMHGKKLFRDWFVSEKYPEWDCDGDYIISTPNRKISFYGVIYFRTTATIDFISKYMKIFLEKPTSVIPQITINNIQINHNELFHALLTGNLYDILKCALINQCKIIKHNWGYKVKNYNDTFGFRLYTTALHIRLYVNLKKEFIDWFKPENYQGWILDHSGLIKNGSINIYVDGNRYLHYNIDHISKEEVDKCIELL